MCFKDSTVSCSTDLYAHNKVLNFLWAHFTIHIVFLYTTIHIVITTLYKLLYILLYFIGDIEWELLFLPKSHLSSLQLHMWLSYTNSEH